MKKRIFTPSTILMRGGQTRTQGGFFCFPFEGDVTPIIRRPAYAKRLRGALPAQVELLTVVFGGPLSFFPPLTSTTSLMEIHTPQGKVIFLDDEDYPLVKGFKWDAKPGGKQWYATTVRPPFQLMHRLIMKAKQGQKVDHINGNGLDNRRDNLRFCTDAENSRNRGPNRTNKTGFKGVLWSVTAKKFQAFISNEGRSKYLGSFDCPFKAARAYDAAARELHGEFANTNFPITG